MHLDHLAICAQTLDEGVAWAQERLGVPIGPGGRHPRYGTHNRLIGLENGLYLEVIAIDPKATPETRPRWFGLDQFTGPPRLANWICRVPDMATALAQFPECGRAIAMTRGDLAWDISVPPDGSLPLDGGLPTLLEWHTQTPPGDSLPGSGLGLQRLEVTHPQAEALSRRITVPHVSFRVGPVGLAAQFSSDSGVVSL